MDRRKEQVLNWIEENRDEVVEFLRKLIQTPSVNPYFDHEPGEAKEGRVQQVVRADSSRVRHNWNNPTLHKTYIFNKNRRSGEIRQTTE